MVAPWQFQSYDGNMEVLQFCFFFIFPQCCNVVHLLSHNVHFGFFFPLVCCNLVPFLLDKYYFLLVRNNFLQKIQFYFQETVPATQICSNEKKNCKKQFLHLRNPHWRCSNITNHSVRTSFSTHTFSNIYLTDISSPVHHGPCYCFHKIVQQASFYK